MARLSLEGERTTLALIADLYAQIVDLREALAAERQARADDRASYDEHLAQLRGQLFEQAGVDDPTAPPPD